MWWWCRHEFGGQEIKALLWNLVFAQNTREEKPLLNLEKVKEPLVLVFRPWSHVIG
jgi:hypothetical protein